MLDRAGRHFYELLRLPSGNPTGGIVFPLCNTRAVSWFFPATEDLMRSCACSTARVLQAGEVESDRSRSTTRPSGSTRGANFNRGEIVRDATAAAVVVPENLITAGPTKGSGSVPDSDFMELLSHDPRARLRGRVPEEDGEDIAQDAICYGTQSDNSPEGWTSLRRLDSECRESMASQKCENAIASLAASCQGAHRPNVAAVMPGTARTHRPA